MVQVNKKNQRVKHIKKVEKYLRQYTTYKIGIMTLQKQLDYIMPNITATYELAEGSIGTFNIKSDTEAYAIDRIESKRALMLHEDMARYNLIVESIDVAVSELDDHERSFVQLRYINRHTIQRTSIELGYSEKHIFNLRHQVMDKLLISLRGLVQF